MNIFIWILIAATLFFDQLTKLIISRSLTPNESVEVLKNFFYLTRVHNTGAAFGIFKNETFFFTVISMVTVIGLIAYMRRKKNAFFLQDMALALILGGALGNLLDRLRFGYVVDFLDFRVWPVFNIADSAITAGAFLLIIALLTETRKRKNVS